jgi:hypothetical protein
LKSVAILVDDLLGVEPIIKEAKDRSLDILKRHALCLSLLEDTIEGSGEERWIVGNDVLVDAEWLGSTFAVDGDEALSFRRAVSESQKMMKSGALNEQCSRHELRRNWGVFLWLKMKL